MGTSYRLLRAALALVGVVMLLLYPLAVVWPAGFAWHAGAPYESDYFMMIVGVYATLGVFLLLASRAPEHHVSLIWFAVWSSVVHAGVMTVESVQHDQLAHLWGDVAALLAAAVVLGVLVVRAGLTVRGAGPRGADVQHP